MNGRQKTSCWKSYQLAASPTPPVEAPHSQVVSQLDMKNEERKSTTRSAFTGRQPQHSRRTTMQSSHHRKHGGGGGLAMRAGNRQKICGVQFSRTTSQPHPLLHRQTTGLRKARVAPVALSLFTQVPSHRQLCCTLCAEIGALVLSKHQIDYN